MWFFGGFDGFDGFDGSEVGNYCCFGSLNMEAISSTDVILARHAV